MKKLFFAFLCLGLVLASTGCWSARSLDDRAYVYALGIDPGEKEDEFRFSFQIVKPEAFGPNAIDGPAFEVVEAVGPTLFQAIRNVLPRAGQKLFFPHMQVVIFSREIGEKGIAPFLDMLSRDPEFSLRPWIMMIDNLPASQALNLEHPGARIPGVALDRAITLGRGTKFAAVTLKDFLMNLEGAGRAPTATRLVVQGKGPKKELFPSGTAVFHHDRLVGTLTETETRGMHWITGEAQQGILLLAKPLVPDPVVLEYNQASRRIIPLVEEGILKFIIEIKIQANIGESFGQIPLTDEAFWQTIKKAGEEALAGEAQAAVRKIQELGPDVLGLGRALQRKYPRLWQEVRDNWEQLFPTLEIQIITQVKLQGVGDIIKSSTKEQH